MAWVEGGTVVCQNRTWLVYERRRCLSYQKRVVQGKPAYYGTPSQLLPPAKLQTRFVDLATGKEFNCKCEDPFREEKVNAGEGGGGGGALLNKRNNIIR